MSNNSEEQEEELIPKNIQIAGFWASLIFSIILLVYYVLYICNVVEASPKDLGLSPVLLFSLTCFLFFAIPWHKLGLSLKKFGPLEFERKLEGQSEEHIKDISALEDKIEQIESILKLQYDLKQQPPREQLPEEIEFKELIVKFLNEYSQWSFSPLRIENWGSKRAGYEKLSGNSSQLRKLLRSLVSEGVLETRVSEKGNTLYRIKN